MFLHASTSLHNILIHVNRDGKHRLIDSKGYKRSRLTKVKKIKQLNWIECSP